MEGQRGAIQAPLSICHDKVRINSVLPEEHS